MDNDPGLKSQAGLHPVPEECGVFTAFKISHFPPDHSAAHLTLSVLEGGSRAGVDCGSGKCHLAVEGD